MKKIEGITITLIDKVKVGKNPFGEDIFEDKEIEVDNVLIGHPTTDDIVNSQELYGKKLVYILGIPKDDTNNWKDVEVRFFNEKFRTFGHPTQGIENLIPLEWNKKVRVEYYE